MLSGLETRRSIYRLAQSQHGVVAWRQLIALGIGRDLITHWLKRGRLFRIFPGAYSVGRPADGFRSIWMAATLCAGPGAVLSGRSAAAAFGIVTPGNRIEVSRPTGRLRRVNGVRPHQQIHLAIRSTPLIEGDTVQFGAIPVMSVSRLLIELAGSMNNRQLRRAFVEAGRLDLLTSSCLERCETRGAGFKGRARLTSLIGFWRGGRGKVRSGLEGEFRLLYGQHDVPHPLRNQWVCGYEFDCLWPDSGLVIELDSKRFHDDEFGFENDRIKSNSLTLTGYRLIRLTHSRITNEPEAVASEILQALRTGGVSEPVLD